MTSSGAKYLIVNADDFGLSPGVNRGILQAHKHGIVTSASLMVRQPAAAEAAAEAKAFPELSVGLHVDLGEWAYRDGEWIALYEVLSEADAESRDAVAGEVDAQLVAFRRLTGRDPTHLDSHQHVHRTEPLKSILTDLASRLRVPLRHFDNRVRYVGDFYGHVGKGEPYPQGITTDALLRIISELPPGVSELCCHPAAARDHASPYGAERQTEVMSLCDPRVRAALTEHGVQLVSFSQGLSCFPDSMPSS